LSTQCPQCHQEITIEPQNFGTLYSCPHCKSAFFVDWSGNPEVFQASVESSQPESIQPESIQPESVIEAGSIQPESINNFPDPFVVTEPIMDPVPELESAPEDFFNRVAETQQPESIKTLEDFSDVVNYSNATEPTEAIVYNLFISGLDSKKQIDIFTGAISDSKMGWLVDDILSQVSLGKIKLENLNAPKLHVLIQRLKFSGLDLRWEQKVLS